MEREREAKAIIQYTGNYNETQGRTYNGLTTVNITERERAIQIKTMQ